MLVCQNHMYSPSPTAQPVAGCKDCSFAYWLDYFAKTPPHKRAEMVEMLIEAGMQLVEAERRGELDEMALYSLPQVQIEKNALPD